MSVPNQSDSVRHYYDRNTRRFLALGVGGGQLAIRRGVWAPGVSTRQEAMQYVNRRILGEMEEIGAREVLDLGCGVGGSIIYLYGEGKRSFLGVTLSPVQADLAARAFEQAGAKQAQVTVGDFCDPSFWAAREDLVDLAFSIEATVHVPDLTEVLAGAAEAVRPGGRLVIVDDFLNGEEPRSPRAVRWLREFREGWRAPGLRTPDELRRQAERAGFRLLRDEDLTSCVELDRPRDLLARAFINVFRWWPGRGAWFSNLYGGNALQLLLKARIVTYRYVVFERSTP
ncbi:MAG: SAM-dependent methyltransferase [Alkalispirochaetaceae bacterium]